MNIHCVGFTRTQCIFLSRFICDLYFLRLFQPPFKSLLRLYLPLQNVCSYFPKDNIKSQIHLQYRCLCSPKYDRL